MTQATAHPNHRLISSEDATDVYGIGEEAIGQIDHLLIEKISGRVAYAVMSFGGFLGLARNHYPIPWSALKYDTALQGYRTGITEGQLKDAPEFSEIPGPIEIGKRAPISTMEHPPTGELDQFSVPRNKRWRNECHLSKSDTDGRRAHSHAYHWM